ncbi:MAG TPA: hypothetical protein VH253_13970 [Phycisphaerae bacterium]|nr:hypothetical protein [Phycisphaerae bacterium]
MSEFEMPLDSGGSGDSAREEREVLELHDAVQDSAGGADAEPGRPVSARGTKKQEPEVQAQGGAALLDFAFWRFCGRRVFEARPI